MNLTSLEHAAVAITVQTVIGLLTGNWWAGAAAGAFLFVGREHAQAEYRWIEMFGQGLRRNMPEFGGFDRRVWMEVDCWLDWLVPAMACVGLASIVEYGF